MGRRSRGVDKRATGFSGLRYGVVESDATSARLGSDSSTASTAGERRALESHAEVTTRLLYIGRMYSSDDIGGSVRVRCGRARALGRLRLRLDGRLADLAPGQRWRHG